MESEGEQYKGGWIVWPMRCKKMDLLTCMAGSARERTVTPHRFWNGYGCIIVAVVVVMAVIVVVAVIVEDEAMCFDL